MRGCAVSAHPHKAAAGMGQGRVRHPVPGRYRRDHAVRAHDDGQRRVGPQDRQGLRDGGPAVAGEADVDPAGVRVRAGLAVVSRCR